MTAKIRLTDEELLILDKIVKPYLMGECYFKSMDEIREKFYQDCFYITGENLNYSINTFKRIFYELYGLENTPIIRNQDNVLYISKHHRSTTSIILDELKKNFTETEISKMEKLFYEDGLKKEDIEVALRQKFGEEKSFKFRKYIELL